MVSCESQFTAIIADSNVRVKVGNVMPPIQPLALEALPLQRFRLLTLLALLFRFGQLDGAVVGRPQLCLQALPKNGVAVGAEVVERAVLRVVQQPRCRTPPAQPGRRALAR